jgi:hypothetical protein
VTVKMSIRKEWNASPLFRFGKGTFREMLNTRQKLEDLRSDSSMLLASIRQLMVGLQSRLSNSTTNERYSMTSSARPSSDRGTAMLSILAVSRRCIFGRRGIHPVPSPKL